VADDLTRSSTPSRPQNEDLLAEIRERFDYATAQWQEIRTEGAEDIRYVGGDPWDPKDRKTRLDAGRPTINADEIGQYVNQLINDVRQNKRGIEVTPLTDEATDESAELHANLIRQIEYRSNAQQAYTTMFENAVQRSYGFLRILPKYLNDRSHDQELLIEPLVNPDLVTVDPDSLKPDGSDMQYAFIRESYSRKEFRRKWPHAAIHDFSDDDFKTAPKWLGSDRVWVAEYWAKKVVRKRRLLLVQTPNVAQAVYDDELTNLKEIEPYVLKEREVDELQVTQYLTNGIEILEKPLKWPGKSIPLVCCYGKVLYVDEGGGSQRKLLSLVRLARDPQMLYAYLVSTEAELVGGIPKFPYFAYEGQLSATEQENLAKSLHEPIALIKVRAIVEGMAPGTPLPFPQRNPWDPPLQGLEIAKESARRMIQAAMGTAFLPTQAQRRNEKSGIALKQIEQNAQKGSFHFIDHYDEAITRCGAILEELLPHYYDTARTVSVREESGETKRVPIKKRRRPGEQPLSIGQPGTHDVTLSTGPSFASEREAASDFADTLAGTPLAPLVMDLVVKLKNLGPIGNEMSDRFKAMLPAPVQQMIAAKDQQLTPELLMGHLTQAQATVQQLQQMVQQLQQELATEQAKQQATMAKAALDSETKVTLQKMDDATKLAVADIGAKVDAAKLVMEQFRAVVDAAEERRLSHEAMAHETATQHVQHAHEVDQAEKAADAAAEQQFVAGEQALSQQAAQAQQKSVE